MKTVVEVRNQLGLHARAAARLVRLASRFTSEISLRREGRAEAIDAKSILSILMLAAAQGATLELEACGPDAVEAIEAVERLFRERFGEEA